MLWDRATYLGPPDSNYSGPMQEVRGLVLHIAEGSYQGTISWQRNPDSDVSSHFVIGLGGFRTGEVAQMLDTNVTAWTQGAGNGHWISVENAGFHTDQFTPEQIEANAQLLAWLMLTHGVPATIATDPSGRGLGHHGMGGVAWGNHPLCPGPANVALKPTILARAVKILNGGSDMQQYFFGREGASDTDPKAKFYLCDGMFARGPLERPASAGQTPVGRDEIADIKQLASEGMFTLWKGGAIRGNMTAAFGQKIPWSVVGGLVPHTHAVVAQSGPAEPN